MCNSCSKYKLPNADGVKQRACKKCYFNVGDQVNNNIKPNDPKLSMFLRIFCIFEMYIYVKKHCNYNRTK